MADVRRLRRQPGEAPSAVPSDGSVAHGLLTGKFQAPTRAGPDAPWTSSLSSLAPAQTQALAAQAWPERHAAHDEPDTVSLQGEAFEALPIWLGAPARQAGGASVLALVSLSVDEAVRLPRDLPIVHRSCGEPNAFYSPSEGELQMCYELLTSISGTSQSG